MEDTAFSTLATELQRRLGALQSRLGEFQSPRSPSVYLLRKLQRLKLKMYQEKGHALPHLHVDYGSDRHTASYSIDPPQRIEGTLKSKEDAVVIKWIASNKDELLAAWQSFQAGNPDSALLAELRGKA